jgi:hypothetical protein
MRTSLSAKQSNSTTQPVKLMMTSFYRKTITTPATVEVTGISGLACTAMYAVQAKLVPRLYCRNSKNYGTLDSVGFKEAYNPAVGRTE